MEVFCGFCNLELEKRGWIGVCGWEVVRVKRMLSFMVLVILFSNVERERENNSILGKIGWKSKEWLLKMW